MNTSFAYTETDTAPTRTVVMLPKTFTDPTAAEQLQGILLDELDLTSHIAKAPRANVTFAMAENLESFGDVRSKKILLVVSNPEICDQFNASGLSAVCYPLTEFPNGLASKQQKTAAKRNYFEQQENAKREILNFILT